jgi:hypothetical protein
MEIDFVELKFGSADLKIRGQKKLNLWTNTVYDYFEGIFLFEKVPGSQTGGCLFKILTKSV